ncbi:hypothetical protein HYALB_00008419 [Hymenoscyphus albidus]|uniref:Ubiquitin-like protease family profile domain-containing protein n=1 Tax=Hymenoscyphus albidus TaxID=595503 RepID=A0A9N9LSI6_9HELO|nr:hypothetical protein HYALB_00008419 [Hymenoscyphus albidus]
MDATLRKLKQYLQENAKDLSQEQKLKCFDEFRLMFWNEDLLAQAISTRLPKSANQKREAFEFLDLAQPHKLNSQTFDTNVPHPGKENLIRFSEEIEYTKCAKKRHLLVNYESGSMPSESPGKTRRLLNPRHTKSQPSQLQHDKARESSPPPVTSRSSRSRASTPSAVESDNDAEDEDEDEESLSAKRGQRSKRTTNPPREPVVLIEVKGQTVLAKPKTNFDDEGEGKINHIIHLRKKAQRRSSPEKHIINLEEDDSPKTPPPKSGKETFIEGEAGDIDANAAQVHSQSTNSPVTPWKWGRERLARQIGRVHPQFPIPSNASEYSFLKHHAEKEESKSVNSMTTLLNGGLGRGVKHKPYSGGPKPTNNLRKPSGNLEVVIHSFSPKRKDGETQELSKQPSEKAFRLIAQAQENKRRKTDHRATKSIASPGSSDSDSPTMERSRGLTNPKPRIKKQASSNGQVSSMDEYSSVEGVMNPAPRSAAKTHSSDNNTRSPYFRSTDSTKPASLNEDATDPISDPDEPLRQPKEQITHISQTYKGTANLKPARGRPSKNSINGSKSKAVGTYTGPNAEEPSSSVATAKRKRESDDCSADELATGHFPKKRTEREHAQELLKSADKIKTQTSNLTNGAHNIVGKHATINGTQDFVELSTDDEKEEKKSKITPSKFKTSNRPKPPPKKIDIKVVNAFSTLGLRKADDVEWRIVCNVQDKMLRIVDAGDQPQEERHFKHLRKITEGSDKVILNWLADTTTSNRQSDLFIELGGVDESSYLVEQLSKMVPGTVQLKLDAEKMDKTFANSKKKRVLKPAPPRLPEDIPEDVQFLEKKVQLRHEQRRAEGQESKRAGSTQGIKRRIQNDAAQPQRAEGRARRMEISSLGYENGITSDGFSPASFYNKNNSSDHEIKFKETLPITRQSTRIVRTEPVQEKALRSSPPIPIQWTKQHPDWEKSWRDAVVYPPGPGHKRTATVDREDISRLDEEEFLNDNLVNFYLRYLEFHLNGARPDVAKRIYFQNSYFYERLTRSIEGRKGGIDYEAVQRWTKDVDLFSKDYIIVPVCENLHWYVAIICNAPKLLKPDVEEDVFEIRASNGIDVSASHRNPINLEDDDHPMKTQSLQASHEERTDHENTVVESSEAKRARQESDDHKADEFNTYPVANVKSDLQPAPPETPAVARKVRKAPVDRRPDASTPRIILIDSLGQNHPATSRHLKDYLIAEMKHKHGKDISLSKGIGFSAKNIDMQNNWSDCGLYLLSYIEKFLEDPDSFISIVLGNSAKGDSGWLQPSKLRHDIRDLLIKLSQKKPEGENPFLKTPDVTSATVSSPALRDASTDRTEIIAMTERSSPAEKLIERRFHDGLSLQLGRGPATYTSSSPRMSKSAPPDDFANMQTPANSRLSKRVNATSTKEATDLQHQPESVASSDRPHKSKSRKPASVPAVVIDLDESSTLQEFPESPQPTTRSSLPPKKSLDNKTTFLHGVRDAVTGFVGSGWNMGDKEGAKDLGSSESQPLEVDDSPVKSETPQKHRKRRDSSASVEVISSRAQSKRRRVSPRQSRDSSMNQEKVSQGSDVPDCPNSLGLVEPDVGDMGQRALEPSSPTTAQQDESKVLEDKPEDDDTKMLLDDTNICISESASKSPTTNGNLQQQSSSLSQDEPPYRFNIDVEDDSPAPQTSHPAGRRSDLQQGTHIRFDT